MFELLTLSDINDYFKVKSQRDVSGVYFYRIIGYDDEYLKFLRKYQTFAQRKGIYINKTIVNPDPSDIQYLNTLINNDVEVDNQKIKNQCQNWLKFLNDSQINLISEALFIILKEMQNDNTNINIIKNSYIKFLYWMKYRFENCIKFINQDEVPKVLYEGDIGKYELYMLRILSLAGCDVLYINFLNEESYMKYDIQGKYSMRIIKPIRQNPPIHFSKIDLKQIEERKKIIDNIKEIPYKLNTNQWLKDDFFEDIFSLKRSENETKNMFVSYLGIDKKDEYNNRLYNLKTRMEKENKKYCIIENGIPIPSLDEISKYRFDYKNKEDILFEIIKRIKVTNEDKINQVVKNEISSIIQVSEEKNLAKLYNLIIKLVCWIERYSKKIFINFDWNKLPILIYFGNCDMVEATFLSIMAKLPIDVLYINPNKDGKKVFDEALIKSPNKVIELENDYNEKLSFPKGEVKVRASTVAYNAEKELDTILYNDTGLFREKQFKTCKAITLKTTFEEIAILWKEEAKFRIGFKVEDNIVTVPNIFAKICGVKDNDTNNYFKSIQNLITDKTIIINGFPYIKKETYNPFYGSSNKFVNHDKLNINEIKKFKEYKYGFLNINTQDFILSKIQEIIDLKIIEQNDLSINQKIVSTLLNLDKDLLNLIQQFDFTKDIPKIIITDVNENIASLQDCILIMFLNLIGFDIVIYTPTGYQNIEKYINTSMYEEYQIGNYLYNLQIPRFKIENQKKQKSIKDLFRRRN